MSLIYMFLIKKSIFLREFVNQLEEIKNEIYYHNRLLFKIFYNLFQKVEDQLLFSEQ